MGLFDVFRTSAGGALPPAIEEAAARRDLRAVLDLLPFLPPDGSPTGEAAAAALDGLVAAASPDAIAVFDAWYRQRTCTYPPRPRWEALREWPRASWARAGWTAAHPMVVAVATCHHSGFAREQAVRALAPSEDGRELAFLLVRLNDWVAEVRFAAASLVKARVRASYAAHWVRCLGVLERVSSGMRGDHDWLRGPVDALLQREETRAALETGLVHGHVEVRRGCLRIASGLSDPRRLVRLALEDPDPIVSARAAHALCAMLEGEPLREVLTVMQRGDARARGTALATILARFPEDAERTLRAAMLDRATAVRELARFEWTKGGHGDLDFAKLYRDHLATETGERFVTALRGLAETGTVADVATFERYLHHPRARVREAAVLGLGHCDGQRRIDALVAALDDPNLRVSNAARRHAKLHLGRDGVPKRSPRRQRAEEKSR